MYESVVEVPRLLGRLGHDGPIPPLVQQMAEALSAHYGRSLHRIGAALYRDGRDSVAWHGDRIPNRDDSLIAIVSLGEPRRFLLRPSDGGRSRTFDLGWGDLLVMGGSCQRTWLHSVPKVARADPRISIQLRATDGAGASAGERRHADYRSQDLRPAGQPG